MSNAIKIDATFIPNIEERKLLRIISRCYTADIPILFLLLLRITKTSPGKFIKMIEEGL